MKKLTKYISLSAIIALVVLYQPAKSATKSGGKPVIIRGTLTDGTTRDSVLLMYWKDNIYRNIGAERIYAACDAKGIFKFSLPEIKDGVRFLLYYKGKPGFLFESYAEPGDQIDVRLENMSSSIAAAFSGQGSEKYRCKASIDSAYEAEAARTLNLPEFKLNPGEYTAEQLARTIIRLNQLADAQSKVLNRYKMKIAPAVYEFFEAEIMGKKMERIFFNINWYYSLSTEKEKILELYNFTASEMPVDKSGQLMKIQSPLYIQYLLARVKTELNLTKHGAGYPYGELYGKLKKEYKGLMGEAVLVWSLLEPHTKSQEAYGDFLRDALTILKHKSYYAFIEKQCQYANNKQVIDDFALADSSGKVFTRDSFKGKVVLMEFWSSGCSFCAEFGKAFKSEVYPFFKDNRDILFVTVNIDNKKDRWVSALNGGIFTSPGSVNLFTGGQGFQHPLLRKYNITSTPTLVLLDKEGRLLSLSVSRDTRVLIKTLNAEISKV